MAQPPADHRAAHSSRPTPAADHRRVDLDRVGRHRREDGSAATATAITTTAATTRTVTARLRHVTSQQRLARQIDLAVRPDGRHDDVDLLADRHDVLDRVDAMRLELGDVDEAVLARQNLDERSGLE